MCTFQDENWRSFIAMSLNQHCYTGSDASLVSDVLKDLKASEAAGNTHPENGASNVSEHSPVENGDCPHSREEQGIR